MGASNPAVPAKKISLVGFASNTRDLAPYKDASWEIWGLNNLYAFIPRYTRWFEMHDPAQILGLYGQPYVDFLKGCTVPLYMQKHVPEYPASIAFPLAELGAQGYGGEDGQFWPSSISYMLALAISEQPAEIALYGIDLVGGDEHSLQREGCGFLIGLARGRGIKVTIPPAASLLKSSYRYGYDPGQWSPDEFDTFLAGQAAMYDGKKRESEAALHVYDGATQAYTNARTMYAHARRGGRLAGVPPKEQPKDEGLHPQGIAAAGVPGPVPGAPEPGRDAVLGGAGRGSGEVPARGRSNRNRRGARTAA